MFDSDKYYDCELDKLFGSLWIQIRSLGRRIRAQRERERERERDFVQVLALAWIEYERERERERGRMGGEGYFRVISLAKAWSKNFQNFSMRQLFPFRRVICTSCVLYSFFFFFSFFFHSLREITNAVTGKETNFVFATKSWPEMEPALYVSRSTAGKYRFCKGPSFDTSSEQTGISCANYGGVDLHL